MGADQPGVYVCGAAGRCAHPSAAIMDSQSVKTTEVGGPRGYDAGKEVEGRKRRVLVDTLGHLLNVVVRLLKIWADGGYCGALIDWCWQQMQTVLEIVALPPDQQDFTVLPRRWVVERTFAWLGNYRRLSKLGRMCPQQRRFHRPGFHSHLAQTACSLIFKWVLSLIHRSLLHVSI